MDYKDAKRGSESAEKLAERSEKSTSSGYWWKFDDGTDRAQKLCAAGTYLREQQRDRAELNLANARLYGNMDIASFGVRDYTRSIAGLGAARSPKTAFNVCANATDTLTSKIAKNKPRASFTTSGASWKVQQRARRLDYFARGLFYKAKAYDVMKTVFRDNSVFGTGLAKVFMNDAKDKVEVERVFIDEIFVDDADAVYGYPRQLLQRKLVAKEVLLARKDLSDECRAAILAATVPDEIKPLSGFGDVVEVWEGWHLRSSKSSKDGWHVVAIQGHEIFSEEWKLDRFPFVKMNYRSRLLGWWGQGVCEILTGIQIEMNRLVRSISDQLRRKGRGRIFAQKGSGVNPAHLTNGVGDIVYYVGSPPVVDSSNAVAPEEFQQIDRLYQKAYQEVGLSELSVAARKPSGLDAAVALREYSEIESDRFAELTQAWETAMLDLTELMLDIVRVYGGKSFKSSLPLRNGTLRTLEWGDIDLEKDAYEIQIFPVSSLPQTPGARLQRIQELLQGQFIDMPTALRLMEMPDIEQEMNLLNAKIDDVDATISSIMDEDKPKLMPIEPYQDLAMLIKRATSAYLFARHHGAEEDRLDMLRALIDDASAKKLAADTMQMAPPPVPGVPPPPGAMGGGMPAPAISGGVNTNIKVGGAMPAVPPLVAS